MNPLVLTAGVKALEKIDIKKTVMYVGGALLLIVLYLTIRKKLKELKEEKKDEKYMDLVSEEVKTADLSYSESDYYSMADTLEQHFGDTGLSAGYLGVNQKGVYEVMKRIQNDSDYLKLVTVFDKRKFKDLSLWSPALAFMAKEKEYTLPEAMTQLLTKGERSKVNEILRENGVTKQF